ncbi:hypothetical protein OROMI_013645 [Orobanche minor]
MNCTTELSTQETQTNDIPDIHGQLNADKVNGQHSAKHLDTPVGYAADWWSVGIILFELISGTPPFNADHPEKNIFDNILNRKIPWPAVPDEMSCEAQDLIDRLLVYNPDERLGAKGAFEVKAHSFFSGVDWDNLTIQKSMVQFITDKKKICFHCWDTGPKDLNNCDGIMIVVDGTKDPSKETKKYFRGLRMRSTKYYY